ncbi:hypothetical protein J4462_02680 [Candidatus Pacearchaeota archaeon]|nr:hypothetical protein [Candidatus Pacearchaeota archaeon]
MSDGGEGGIGETGDAVATGKEDAGQVGVTPSEVGKIVFWVLGGVLIVGGIVVVVYFVNRKRQMRGY